MAPELDTTNTPRITRAIAPDRQGPQRVDHGARQRAEENVRDAQQQKQRAAQRVRRARSDEATAEKRVQEARADEQRAAQKVRTARRQAQETIQAEQLKQRGELVDVLA